MGESPKPSHAKSPPPKRRIGAARSIRIASLPRAEPDLKLLAQAVVSLAIHQAEEAEKAHGDRNKAAALGSLREVRESIASGNQTEHTKN